MWENKTTFEFTPQSLVVYRCHRFPHAQELHQLNYKVGSTKGYEDGLQEQN